MTESFDTALDTAAEWVGTVPGVVAVGEGEQDGRRTIDVWVSGTPKHGALPRQHGGHPVRVRASGGAFRAQ